MKKCPNCGMNFSDDKLLCPNCGSTPIDGSTEHTYFNARNMNGKKGDLPGRKIEWYESIWFIVICFLVGFWPLGIGMIILRFYRNSAYESMAGVKLGDGKKEGQNGGQSSAPGNETFDAQFSRVDKSRRIKTKSVGKLIGGSILVSLGILVVVNNTVNTSGDMISTFATGGVLAGIGALLIGLFAADNRDWHKYEALIDNRGNTRISFIASRLGIKTSKARNKLQKMINKGFLSEPENNIGAYINGEYDLIVMTRNGKPIVPVEDTVAEEIASRKAREKDAADKARRDGAVTAEDKLLVALNDAVDFTRDVEVIRFLKRIEKSVKSIQIQLKEDPDKGKLKSVINMKESYIPSTIDLIQKYIKPDTTEEARDNIKGMFSTLASAFANLDKKLRKQDEIEMEAEMEVMKQTLARDGLLDSDFDI